MKNGIKILTVLATGLLLTTGCGWNKTKSNSTSTITKTEEGVSVAGTLSIDNLFTNRDLEQTVDTTNATKYTLKDGEDITITKEGIYHITGTAKNATIIVEADSQEKIQIVLDGVSITNDDFPCIYVKSADKVWVTTVNENTLSTTSSFKADGETSTDAVIFSKDDLVLNGTGSLIINSTENGISSKDDLKITGGTITIECVQDALEANESVAIYDGDISINTKKDGIHSEYDEDNSVGYVYIGGGTLNITATDDGIHATTVVQIDGGTININAAEGMEGTYIQINDGTITITAKDDAINGAQQSKSYTATIEINGGNLSIDMGQGDTDAIDSNGNIYINGGKITINAQSPFDYDGEAKYSGGTMIVNGEETTTISNQMMGGPNGQNYTVRGNQKGRR